MWRSVVARTGSFSRGSVRTKLQWIKYHHPLSFQVLQFQNATFIKSSFHPHFNKCSFSPKRAALSPNPRFLSDVPSDQNSVGVESHFDSPISQTGEGLNALADEIIVSEDDSRTFPSESDMETFSSLSFDQAGGDAVMMEGLASGEEIIAEEDHIREIDYEQLENVLSLLQSSNNVDGSLEDSLNNMGLTLHEELIVRVLETPLIPGDNLIAFFKWALSKPDVSVTSWMVETLVRVICGGLRKKDAYSLLDLVREIGEKEKGVLNTDTLNDLVSLFSKLGKGKAAFDVFNMFEEFGCVPNEETYYYVIEALGRRSFFDWACSVCEKMLNVGKLPDSEKCGKIISYLCKGSKLKTAHLVYLSAKEKGVHPPKSSVNFLISSLSRGDETVHSALEMLDDFSGEEQKYAIKPFSWVIQGLCRIKDIKRAKNLLFRMIDAGPPPGNAVFNYIINGLSKVDDMEEAKKLVKLMENRGLKPDVYAYSVIMSGHAKGGEMEEACKVLAEAKARHSELSPVTYHTLIRGYCKLEEFDKALKLLSEMKDHGVQPNADEYNKLIQSLCLKALDWKTAEKLLDEMKANGLYLNGVTKGLIRAVKEMVDGEVGTEEVAVQV